MRTEANRRRFGFVVLTTAVYAIVSMLAGGVGQAWAEAKTVRISVEFGLPYLPVYVARDHKLIEKHAKELGLQNVKMSITQLGSASITNDALLAGDIDLAIAGIGGLLQMWDKTNGNVKALMSINDMVQLCNTNDPRVKTLKDYVGITDHKIAVTAVKVSIQAIILEMAAAKILGPSKQYALDSLTVSMAHPQAYAALISGHSGIRSSIANLPYSYFELKHPNIHTVFSSYDILGGPHVNVVMYTTKQWITANSKVKKAVFDAFVEADKWIEAHPQTAATLFKKDTKSKFKLSDLAAMIGNKKLTNYAPEPKATMKFADFMYKHGQIKKQPANWKDYFWDIAHPINGS